MHLWHATEQHGTRECEQFALCAVSGGPVRPGAVTEAMCASEALATPRRRDRAGGTVCCAVCCAVWESSSSHRAAAAASSNQAGVCMTRCRVTRRIVCEEMFWKLRCGVLIQLHGETCLPRQHSPALGSTFRC